MHAATEHATGVGVAGGETPGGSVAVGDGGAISAHAGEPSHRMQSPLAFTAQHDLYASHRALSIDAFECKRLGFALDTHSAPPPRHAVSSTVESARKNPASQDTVHACENDRAAQLRSLEQPTHAGERHDPRVAAAAGVEVAGEGGADADGDGDAPGDSVLDGVGVVIARHAEPLPSGHSTHAPVASTAQHMTYASLADAALRSLMHKPSPAQNAQICCGLT